MISSLPEREKMSSEKYIKVSAQKFLRENSPIDFPDFYV